MKRLAACVAVVVGGCSSDGVPADAGVALLHVTPYVKVTWRGGSKPLQISASFGTDDGSELPPDARKTATFRGTTIDLVGTSSQPTYGPPRYAASFPLETPTVEGEPVTITVALGDQLATATVTMPAPFTFDSVTGDLCKPPATLSSSLELHWSPLSTDPMGWGAHGLSHHETNLCVVLGQVSSSRVEDTGTYTLTDCLTPSGPFCAGIEMSLSRGRVGSVDGFATDTQGGIWAYQERTFYDGGGPVH